MIPKSLLSFCIVFLSVSAFSQDWQGDQENLKGRVKSLQHAVHNYASYDNLDYLDGDHFYDYNEAGFLVRKAFSYSVDGQHQVIRIFDSVGTKCLTEFTIQNADTLFRFDFEYDSLGRLETSVYSSHGRKGSTTHYVYPDPENENNGLLYTDQVVRHVIELDEKGRKVKDSNISPDEVIVKTWQYDINGNLLEEKSDLQLAFSEESNPDDPRHYTIAYEYNVLNQLTREVYRRRHDNSIRYDISYVYNDFGDIAFKNYLDPDGEKKYTERFTYEYDSHQNWIRMAMYLESGLRSSETREIIYYPDLRQNWVSVDYLNCLKTDLPCQCEPDGRAVFLLEIDSDRQYISLTPGRANYDGGTSFFEEIEPNSYRVYDHSSDIEFLDTIMNEGSIRLLGDTLVYRDKSGRADKFIAYELSADRSYLTGHVNWLNEQFKKRGYPDLNEILAEDSLNCWCNWELGAMNSLFSEDQNWILEKENDQLIIYRWTNPPTEKTTDLKIKKKKFRSFAW